MVQNHNLHSDTTLTNEFVKTRYFGIAVGPSAVALQGSGTSRDRRSSYAVRTLLSGEITDHPDKALLEQVLASPELSL